MKCPVITLKFIKRPVVVEFSIKAGINKYIKWGGNLNNESLPGLAITDEKIRHSVRNPCKVSSTTKHITCDDLITENIDVTVQLHNFVSNMRYNSVIWKRNCYEIPCTYSS